MGEEYTDLELVVDGIADAEGLCLLCGGASLAHGLVERVGCGGERRGEALSEARKGGEEMAGEDKVWRAFLGRPTAGSL